MSNQNNQQTFIHVGLPRCGSTYLKRKCFCRISKNIVVPRGKLLTAICKKSFDADSYRDAVRAERVNDEESLIVTNEAFSGDMLSSQYSETVAQNLHTAFPNGQVIIFLREQFSFLRSIYLFGVSKGTQTDSLEKFIDRHESTFVEKLQYDKLIRSYQDRFGKDNVNVFLFEMIHGDETQLHEELRSLFGTMYNYPAPAERKNPSINDKRTIAVLRKSNLLMKWVVYLERKINHATWTNHNRIRDIGGQLSLQTPIAGMASRIFACGSKIEVPEEFKSCNAAQISESNRRVMELTGLPLGQYGYLT